MHRIGRELLPQKSRSPAFNLVSLSSALQQPAETSPAEPLALNQNRNRPSPIAADPTAPVWENQRIELASYPQHGEVDEWPTQDDEGVRTSRRRFQAPTPIAARSGTFQAVLASVTAGALSNLFGVRPGLSTGSALIAASLRTRAGCVPTLLRGETVRHSLPPRQRPDIGLDEKRVHVACAVARGLRPSYRLCVVQQPVGPKWP